jgi:hypothetical protein
VILAQRAHFLRVARCDLGLWAIYQAPKNVTFWWASFLENLSGSQKVLHLRHFLAQCELAQHILFLHFWIYLSKLFNLVHKTLHKIEF